MDAPRRKGGLSEQAQCKLESVLLGTAVGVGRDMSYAAGPSHAEKLRGERVFVEQVNDNDDDETPPLKLREDYSSDDDDDYAHPSMAPQEGIAPPLLDGGEGESDA